VQTRPALPGSIVVASHVDHGVVLLAPFGRLLLDLFHLALALGTFDLDNLVRVRARGFEGRPLDVVRVVGNGRRATGFGDDALCAKEVASGL
jgi:hypothetical protein